MRCLIENCGYIEKSRGLCSRHYMHWWRGRLKAMEGTGLRRAANGSGCIDSNGYVKVMINGRSTYEHIVLAEKALGKKLPMGAKVHHTGKRWENHGLFKLVICPDEGYHQLLHRRMKEFGYENN